MIIKAISVFLGGDVCAGSIGIRNGILSSSGRSDMKDTVKEIIGSQEAGMPIIMADVKGMNDRKMSISLIRKIRFRKAETWFMTYIENVDDVFDVFSMDVDMLLIPMHHLRSADELKDIASISDRCIPCIFTDGVSAFLRNGNEDIIRTIRNVSGIYRDMIIFPTERFASERWERIRSLSDNIIPAARDKDEVLLLGSLGFKDIILLISPDDL